MVRFTQLTLALRFNRHTGARGALRLGMNELTSAVGPHDHFQGSFDAPSVLVQYGDYECPDSKAAYAIVKQIQAELGHDLCFVYRHFPLVDIHPYAEPAAEAAEAAHSQGRFWEMHDTLYLYSPGLELTNIVGYAEELDLEAAQIRREVRSHLYLPRVQKDVESGIRSGVHGTPTFFINGVRYQGENDLESLLDALRVRRAA
jgi:protein-disulfide isomerase